MSMPRDNIYSEMNEAWETYLAALENSIDILEKDVEEAKKIAGVGSTMFVNHLPVTLKGDMSISDTTLSKKWRANQGSDHVKNDTSGSQSRQPIYIFLGRKFN
jgi:hypothetical protein